MSGRSKRRVPRSVVLAIVLGLLISAVGTAPGSTDTESNTAIADSPSLLETNDVETTTSGEEVTATNVSFENFAAPTRIQPAENFTVSVDVTNPGPKLVVRRVYYRIEGNVITSKQIPIPADTTKTVTFDVVPADTRGFPHGTYMHGVFTKETHIAADLIIASSTAATTVGETAPEDSTDDGSIPTIQDSDSFAVLKVDFPSSVQSNETVSVSAIVSNPNDQQSTQAVTLRLDGTVIERKSITLDPNEQRRVSFSVETGDLQPREHFVSVFTRDFGEVAVFSVEDSGERTTAAR